MIALVLGGAATIVNDLPALPTEGAERMRTLVVAVNRTGITFPHVDHWASLHPECFRRNNGDPEQGWVQQRLRRLSYFERSFDAYELWGPADKPQPGVTPLERKSRADSGLFGVEVAQHLGADRIILCGIPMTETPHFDSDEPWEMANAHWKHWTRAHKAGRLDDVRSMSGRTRDLLGAPTREWLAGASAENTEPEVAGVPYS